MRLIDANALERKLMQMSDDELCEDCCYNVVNAINEAPTVDAVPIVRCRDCRKREFDNCPFNEFCDFKPDDDFYCADGERRESDEVNH